MQVLKAAFLNNVKRTILARVLFKGLELRYPTAGS